MMFMRKDVEALNGKLDWKRERLIGKDGESDAWQDGLDGGQTPKRKQFVTLNAIVLLSKKDDDERVGIPRNEEADRMANVTATCLMSISIGKMQTRDVLHKTQKSSWNYGTATGTQLSKITNSEP